MNDVSTAASPRVEGEEAARHDGTTSIRQGGSWVSSTVSFQDD